MDKTLAETVGNWTATNNGAGITYGLASAALAGDGVTVTLTLNAVASATNTTFITNADAAAHLKITPAAALKDVAGVAYTAGLVTGLGETLTTDSTAGTVNAALAYVDVTHVDVVFSEKVDITTAQTVTNYTLGGTFGLAGNPAAAALQGDGVTVRLTVGDMTGIANPQTVTVDASASVTDVAGIAITTGQAVYTQP